MTFLKVLVKILLLIQIFFAMIDVVDFPSPSNVLCRFGAIFNMARLLVDDFRRGFENGPWWQRLLNGYTITTWMVVLNLGSTGLLVSWLMKYADNIVKVTDCKARLSFEPFSVFLLFHYRPLVIRPQVFQYMRWLYSTSQNSQTLRFSKWTLSRGCLEVQMH